MIRAVLDTNLLVSYLLTHRPPITILIDELVARNELVMVTAPELLAELERVLAYPKLQRYLSHVERKRFLALIMALSEAVDLPADLPRICRDPDDDRLIACAVVGQADVIVSGDGDLLDLERVGDIPIVTAGGLLQMLGQRERDPR
jgi:uncharacterized protein